MKSFLHGKSTHSAPALQVPPSLAKASVGARATPVTQKVLSHKSDHGEPTVEAIKEGDKVVRLVITCGCGEKIEIECLYPAGG